MGNKKMIKSANIPNHKDSIPDARESKSSNPIPRFSSGSENVVFGLDWVRKKQTILSQTFRFSIKIGYILNFRVVYVLRGVFFGVRIADSDLKPAELGTRQFYSFAKTTERQRNRASGNRKNLINI